MCVYICMKFPCMKMTLACKKMIFPCMQMELLPQNVDNGPDAPPLYLLLNRVPTDRCALKDKRNFSINVL